jgi:hypothetical protein
MSLQKLTIVFLNMKVLKGLQFYPRMLGSANFSILVSSQALSLPRVKSALVFGFFPSNISTYNLFAASVQTERILTFIISTMSNQVLFTEQLSGGIRQNSITNWPALLATFIPSNTL